jgi:uncharacterized delta-60 repeat protein
MPLIWDRMEERTLLNAASLDPTFGTGGQVATGFPYHDAPTSATSVVIDSQGPAIVAGTMTDGQGNIRAVVARYEPDGRLDTSFGSGGLVYTPIDEFQGNTQDPLNFFIPEARVALDSLGRILVAGTNTAAPVYGPSGPLGPDLGTRDDFALVRLEPDGRLDTSFGTGGMVTIDIGATDPSTGLPIHTDDFASGVTVEPNGQIVVSGTTQSPPPPGGFLNADNFAVVRLNTDGSLDTGFGTDGRAIAVFPGSPNPNPFFHDPSLNTAQALALAPGGKIVVAGLSNPDEFGFSDFTDQFAVARFNADGSLDSGFGTGGLVTHDFNPGQSISEDDGYAVVVQPDGEIVVGGESNPLSGITAPDFALLRLNVDGTTDPTFGTGGQVLTPIPDNSTFSSLAGLALQPDGKIVAAGWNDNYPQADFVLARYNPDGSLDNGFGNGGLVVTNPPVDTLIGFSIALQPRSGKIVFAGNTFDPNTFTGGFVIERYNPDGSVDTHYGTGGQTSTEFTGLQDVLYPVKPRILPDGKIVVATTISIFPNGGGGEDFGLAEYNPDGSLNTSFGTDGRVATDFGRQQDFVTGLALEFVQGSPKIVVVGSILPPGSGFSGDIGVARYNLDGTLDTSFGHGGEAIVDLGANTMAGGVAVQPDGKIVVVGTTTESGNTFPFTEFSVARLTVAGSLDPSFGNGGIVLTDLSPSGSPGTLDAGATTVLIQPDGRIVVGGRAHGPDDLALARYATNGQLDPSFGTGGEVVVTGPSLPFSAGIADMALQPDGRIIAIGTIETPSMGALGPANDFAVLRLTPNGDLDASFGNGGLVTTDLTSSGSTSTAQNDDHATGVVLQPDGKIVVAGWTLNSGTYDPGGPQNGNGYMAPVLALVRYQPNGALDPTFGSGRITLTSIPTSEDVGLAMQPDGKLIAAYSAVANPSSGTNLGVARFLGMDLAIAGPSSGARNQSLTFTGSFDGQAADATLGVDWLFGDGSFLIFPSASFAGALKVSHAYARSGTYTVTLIVLFPSGGYLVTSQQVTIGSGASATGSSGLFLGGTFDDALASLVDDGGLGVSVARTNPAVILDVASAAPTVGAGRDRFDLELARALVLESQSWRIAVNIADETPAARARRLSHS